ncbi:unnamed protein product [Heligmosomoides polygyrus]|uniref:RTTN_N domain-containing protein n=1 Tax=Heligmosomoides polygyrus TaxID=6339 RepID=A0A183GRH0_HELPZ|nr:unnamed protein product [Heligmosomoides polygyrus]
MSWLSQLLERNSSDPRVRLELGQELLDHLAVSRLPSDTKIINEFCDVVFQWLASSNFKVGAAKELVLKLSESTSQLIVPSVVESSTSCDLAFLVAVLSACFFCSRRLNTKRPKRRTTYELLLTTLCQPYRFRLGNRKTGHGIAS